MDNQFVQIVWKVMEVLKDSAQLEDALTSSLEIMCQMMDCEEGAIWMLDQQSGNLVAVCEVGPTDYVGMSAKPGEGVLGSVLSKGEPIILTSMEKGIPLFSDEDTTGKPLKNLLCVPMKTPLHTIGCIHLGNIRSGQFTREHAEICTNCAAIITLDVEDKGLSFRPNEDRQPMINLRGIVKEFPSGEEIRRILNGIDLDIYEGELLVILGESGCGKSTLLNIIGGMDQMTDGTVVIDGKDFSHPTEQELTDYRREYIGFIFQAYNLMPNLTALENVQFIAELVKNPHDAMEVLQMVGLEEKADRFPSALSGGQQQRVSIARAFVKRPRLILADEPTAALDYETGQGVLRVIERVVREQKTAVVMVTHNVEITKMANRVIKLRGGVVSSLHVNLHPLKADDLVW